MSHRYPSIIILKELIDDIEAKLDDASHGLAALKDLIDAIESKLDNPSHGLANLKVLIDALEAKLDNDAHGLAALKVLIDAIEAKLDSSIYGLDALRILIDALEIKLDNATYGLSALQKLIWAIECKLDNVNWGLYAISAAISAVETKLDSDVYGLSALKTLINTIEGKLDVPANFMADVSGLAPANEYDIEMARITANVATEAKQDTIIGYIDTEVRAIETKLDHGTYGLSAIETLVDEVETLLKDGTYGLSALNTDLGKLLTGIIQGTGTVLPANKSLYDILWVDKNTDEQGSFNWDTSAYITNEQAVKVLMGTKRRKYQVYLDLSNVEGDANFDECYIRVYVRINSGVYKCIDKATKTKANLQDTPGVPVEIPMTAEDAKVTLQMKTALAVDKTIDYSWVEEKMEY